MSINHLTRKSRSELHLYNIQVSKGYCNWKDATRAFKKHKESKTHIEAVEAMIILPKTTSDVGELLSSSHKSEKQEARDILKIIISSVRFLARQGLALRGHDEANSNLVQLLRLRAEDNPLLGKWLERSWRKFTSHENQNEFLEVMSYMVLRKLLGDIHNSPYLMVMVDETTDVANKEQLTFVIRWVDESLDVHEEFLGLYNLSSTTADSIVAFIKDILLRFEIPAAKLTRSVL